jgi:hypothetical protein
MQTFEYKGKISAPNADEARRKLACLETLGSILTLSELEKLKETVESPVLLDAVKKKLGLK